VLLPSIDQLRRRNGGHYDTLSCRSSRNYEALETTLTLLPSPQPSPSLLRWLRGTRPDTNKQQTSVLNRRFVRGRPRETASK
jgi:hypothetical protein